MDSRSFSSDGIVLRRINYSESDRIITLLTRNYGKIDFIAKGVRKLKSRKRGSVEIFSKVRFSAGKSKWLPILNEVSSIDLYPEIRKSLKKTALAYYFSEAIGKIVHQGEVNEDLYLLLEEYLDKLKTTTKLKILRLEFTYGLLTLMGYWPIDKPMNNHSDLLEEVLERKINSEKIGKKMLE